VVVMMVMVGVVVVMMVMMMMHRATAAAPQHRTCQQQHLVLLPHAQLRYAASHADDLTILKHPVHDLEANHCLAYSWLLLWGLPARTHLLVLPNHLQGRKTSSTTAAQTRVLAPAPLIRYTQPLLSVNDDRLLCMQLLTPNLILIHSPVLAYMQQTKRPSA
jgi:hypothetical protein